MVSNVNKMRETCMIEIFKKQRSIILKKLRKKEEAMPPSLGII